MDKFYTVKEVADTLRVSEMTIYRYIKAGKIKAIKMEQKVRISEKNFKEYLKSIETKED